MEEVLSFGLPALSIMEMGSWIASLYGVPPVDTNDRISLPLHKMLWSTTPSTPSSTDSSPSRRSTTPTRRSMIRPLKRNLVQVEDMNLQKLLKEVELEGVCLEAAKLFLDRLPSGEGGGALIVQAPEEELEALPFSLLDGGHFAKRLEQDRGHAVSAFSDHFWREFNDFRRHKETDRDRFGNCCDGGIGISASQSLVLLAATRFDCIDHNYDWQNCGTRHAAAFGVASSLELGVVYVNSDAGDLHVITATGAKHGRAFRFAQ
jgi:hypothetical protein